MMYASITASYQARYGATCTTVIRSPGRVNLIGEHTDYNKGYVLPMALEQATWLAIRPRSDQQVRLFSENLNAQVTLDMQNFGKGNSTSHWEEYLKAVVRVLQQNYGPLLGFDGLLSSDLLLGAGLSSSASFQLALMQALVISNRKSWDTIKMAKLCQKAESSWIGVQCGIMDQLVCAAAKFEHALLIDCESLERLSVRLPNSIRVVVMDTGTRRALINSAYNERRKQCQAAAKFFNRPALRWVTMPEVQAAQGKLHETLYRRVYHVVSENIRTLAAAHAMRHNDLNAFGKLMVESHQSLRENFEVTNDALNKMVEIALNTPGCYGARMTGAGFGGCAVALVANEQVENFITQVAYNYQEQTHIVPKLYASRACQGCSVVMQSR